MSNSLYIKLHKQLVVKSWYPSLHYLFTAITHSESHLQGTIVLRELLAMGIAQGIAGIMELLSRCPHLLMTNLLNRFRDLLEAKLLTLLPEPTPAKPTINSMGQHESGVAAENIGAVMEWLFASLINAGYFERSHLFWLHTHPDVTLHRELRRLHDSGEPVFGYRCGNRMPAPPDDLYWRLMSEHASMRIYQLEVKEDV